MRKHLGYVIVWVCVLTLWMSGCDSSQYNYKRVFLLTNELWVRAEKVSDADVFIIKLRKSEFEHIKPLLSIQGFQDWQPLYRVYSGKFELSINSHGYNHTVPIFSVNKRTKLQGVFPVIVYYPNENLLYLVVADMIGG